jgi:DNA-directed RNA polymerase specialized sigma24 family protein
MPPEPQWGRAVSVAVDQRAADVESPSRGAEVVRHMPGGTPAELRVDFGAHLEANYQRLVAQLYAITLDPGEAHDVVQDAYSRAWRSWVAIGRTPDPSAWIRRVAVRSTIRSWRRVLARVGIGRPRGIGAGADQRTRALLRALGRLSAAERRAVVLHHMAGVPLEEIAAIEQTTTTIVQARLTRGRYVVTEGMADVLEDVLGGAGGSYDDPGYDDPGYDDSGYDDSGYDDSGYGPSDGGYANGYDLDGRDDEEARR